MNKSERDKRLARAMRGYWPHFPVSPDVYEDQVEAILRQQIDDLLAYDITYQAHKALTMLAMICTLHQEFDKFIPLAKEMGTREWKRITSMSEMAENNQRPELALAVYQAALGPGTHEQYLRKEYNKLKRRIKLVFIYIPFSLGL